jgi:hypothetical protein
MRYILAVLFSALVISLFLSACDASKPDPPPPKPDLRIKNLDGYVQATLVTDPGYWQERIGGSGELVGVEPEGKRYTYDYTIRLYYRIIREAEHEAGPDTIPKTYRREETRDDNRLVAAAVEERTDLSDEWTMPDSIVVTVELQSDRFDQKKRVTSTTFQDDRGGDGSLE